jgi:hypothetical protein
VSERGAQGLISFDYRQAGERPDIDFTQPRRGPFIAAHVIDESDVPRPSRDIESQIVVRSLSEDPDHEHLGRDRRPRFTSSA